MIGNFINRLNELDYNYVGLYSSYNWLTNIIDLNLLADYIPICLLNIIMKTALNLNILIVFARYGNTQIISK